MVAPSPLVQEPFQQFPAGPAAAPLPLGAGVRRQSQVTGGGQGPHGDPDQRSQGDGRGQQGFGHALFPGPGPAAAILQAPDHAEAGAFLPGDPPIPGPGRHAAVPVVGPEVARLLVAPETGDAKAAMGGLQHSHLLTNADHQRLAQAGQRLCQLLKRLPAEAPLPG